MGRTIAKRAPVVGVGRWAKPPAGWSPEKWALLSRAQRRHAGHGLGMPRHRENPAVAARGAGNAGWHAQPMDSARRIEAYNRQTGRTRQDVTPKQRRRANRKLFAQMRRMPVEVMTP